MTFVPRPISFIIIWFAMMTSITFAHESSQFQRMVDKLVAPYVRSQNFSGAILVADGGNIVLSKGYGMANTKNAIPATPDTRFYIASVSKTFTAVAILLLQERGLLDVNDPIGRFIPDYPNGEKITIHQLLIHTSGLPRIVFFPDFIELSKKHYTTQQAAALFRDKPLLVEPGERFGYSNANYILLAYVIESVSGMDYDEFLNVNLLNPLGLSNTGHQNGSEKTSIATGYEPVGIDELEKAGYFDYSIFVGAGSLYSTTYDLYNWITAICSGHVLQPGTTEQMFTKHIGDRGYAWIITQEFGRKVISLEGWSNTGFTSSLTYYPNDDLTIVLLNNINSRNVKSEIVQGVSALFFGETYSPLSFSAEPLKDELIQQIVGTYQFGEDFYIPHSRITIVEHGGHLFVDRQHVQRPVALLRTSDLEFIHRSSWERTQFQMNETGQVSELLYGKFRAEKLPIK